jgi:enoyl-CoA hydratase
VNPTAPGYELALTDGVAEIRLGCGKANALNPRSVSAVARAFEDAEHAGSRGVVLTGYDRYFSAGLDLVSLYDLERPAMDAFVREFDRTMLRVFAFPRPVVAAVNGHAVAGGCILALACDARLVREDDDVRIGLNEIRLGLPFPASALEIARQAIPTAALESVLYGGALYRPAEALGRGFIDGLASGGDVRAEALVLCRRLCEAPTDAFATIKGALKDPAVRRASAALDELRRAFVDAWFSPEARRRIGEARSRLRG